MIKIEFSGSGDEVRNEMLRLLGLAELKAQAEAPVQRRKRKATTEQPVPVKARRRRGQRKTAASAEAGWTEKEAETLLNQIKSNAKTIVAELATRPEGYRRSDLAQVLGLEAQSIRGRLSSVGFALKRMGKKPSPISNEKVDGEFTYKLDPVVAAAAKQLLPGS